MDNVLWQEISYQKDNTINVVHHLFGPERERLAAAARFLNNERPIVFIGVASAAYLNMPAEVYLGQQGRVASTLCASDALYSYLPALRNANVVINSRSGETVEVVKLAQALKAEGIPFVIITNEPQSTAAKLAEHIVWSSTYKDTLVSINVVTGMMLTTLALAAAIVGKLDAMQREQESLAQAMPGVVERALHSSETLGAFFAGVRPIYLLYRGHSKGSALCGRLVLEEVARTPGTVIEAAEFRQGPNEVIDGRFGAIVLVPSGKPGELNRSLARDILAKGGRVLMVGTMDEQAVPREMRFPLPDVPDYLRPALEIVPLQALAFDLARRQGYQPGEVRYITRVITTETGIPNEL